MPGIVSIRLSRALFNCVSGSSRALTRHGGDVPDLAPCEDTCAPLASQITQHAKLITIINPEVGLQHTATFITVHREVLVF